MTVSKTLLILVISALIGCADSKDFPINCDSKEIAHFKTRDYEFVDQNLKIKIPDEWPAIDASHSDFDGILFGDRTQDNYSAMAIMVYDSISMSAKEYSNLTYENILKEDNNSKAQRGQIKINGRTCYWHFAHDYKFEHSIGIFYYIKDEETSRLIVIPTSTTFIDSHEEELCKLKKLVETLEIK